MGIHLEHMLLMLTPLFAMSFAKQSASLPCLVQRDLDMLELVGKDSAVHNAARLDVNLDANGCHSTAWQVLVDEHLILTCTQNSRHQIIE